jgi:hypothetical protein
MKRRTRVLLSTISTAALTAVLGMPASAMPPPVVDTDRRPIERLASIREGYLAALALKRSALAEQSGDDQVAQFRNFPNFPNFSNWRNR